VLAGQAGSCRKPQPVQLIIALGILFDVDIPLRNVCFRLVIIIIADKVLDRIVGKQLDDLISVKIRVIRGFYFVFIRGKKISAQKNRTCLAAGLPGLMLESFENLQLHAAGADQTRHPLRFAALAAVFLRGLFKVAVPLDIANQTFFFAHLLKPLDHLLYAFAGSRFYFNHKRSKLSNLKKMLSMPFLSAVKTHTIIIWGKKFKQNYIFFNRRTVKKCSKPPDNRGKIILTYLFINSYIVFGRCCPAKKAWDW